MSGAWCVQTGRDFVWTSNGVTSADGSCVYMFGQSETDTFVGPVKLLTYCLVRDPKTGQLLARTPK